MTILEKVKRWLGFGAQAPELVDYDREYALRIKAHADKIGSCGTGMVAKFPKVARAFEFYMREPCQFRGYGDPAACMQDMLKGYGIDTPSSALRDKEQMAQFWELLEQQLPSTGSVHEQWAARHYVA